LSLFVRSKNRCDVPVTLDPGVFISNVTQAADVGQG
jgi:hypothetical protein